MPGIYCLMGSKTESAYVAVLRFVATIVNVSSWQVIMTDFELALRNAARIVIPNALLSGCEIHNKRVSLRKIEPYNKSL